MMQFADGIGITCWVSILPLVCQYYMLGTQKWAKYFFFERPVWKSSVFYL